MPKRKEPQLPPKEQFKRFVEPPESMLLTSSGKEMERAFKKLAPRKKKGF